jgi:hypothetical protein
MANQPKPPTPPPTPKPPEPPSPAAEAKVEGHAVKHGEPATPVKTIADEQRERSEEMQGEGMQAWKDEHDERDPDEKPKTVPGVQHRPVEEHETQRGGRR